MAWCASDRNAMFSVAWQCGVYLAPMAAAQSFCVHPPSWHSPASAAIPPEAAEGSCVSACLSADHALVSLLPFEFQGGGWSGAYYFLRPYSAFESRTASRGILLEDDQAASASAFVADTLESGFGEVKLQCLPAKSQCYMLQLSFAREYLDPGTLCSALLLPYIHTYIHNGGPCLP